MLYNNKPASPSIELVGSQSGATCHLQYPWQSYTADKACDFMVQTNLYGDNCPTNDPFDRSFYVAWPNQVVIASFFIDCLNTFLYVDIYVSNIFPFTRNDPNLLVYSSKYSIGLYNLPNPRVGKYLVFMPLDTENPFNFSISEIRVWREKDVGLNGTVWNYGGISQIRMVGPIDDFCRQNAFLFGCVNEANYENQIGAFYLDLGSIKTLSGIWVLFGSYSIHNTCIGHQPSSATHTQFQSLLTGVLPNSFCQTSSMNFQEVWLAGPITARYIFVCPADGSNYCQGDQQQTTVKKIAAFESESDILCLEAYINLHNLPTPTIYDVYAIATPQEVLRWTLHSDSVGQQNSQPLRCGLKTYSTDKTWATVEIPPDPVNGWYKLIINTSQYAQLTHTVNILVKFSHTAYPGQTTQSVQVTLRHPCINTLLTSTQTIPTLEYALGSTGFQYTFQKFTSSADEGYSIVDFCSLIYQLEPTTDATNFGVSVNGLNIQVLTSNQALIGQSIQLSLYAQSHLYPQIPASQRIPFTVQILQPCLNTIIQLPFSSLNQMSYIVTGAILTQTFTAPTDSVSVANSTPGFCGSFDYSILPTSTSAWISVDYNRNIRVHTVNLSHAGFYTLTLNVKLLSFTGVPAAQVAFQVTLTNPCLTTTLIMPSTLNPVTITSTSGTIFAQNFYPFTDSAALNAGIKGLCGDRVYSIVETEAQSVVSIISPVAPLDPLEDLWYLHYQTNDAAIYGTFTVTLKATLQQYQSITATQTITLTINHACTASIILSQSMTPLDYQIRYAGTTQTIYQFTMHQDSRGNAEVNPMFCGLKTYSTSQSWLSVVAPANPLTGPFELRVTTSDYSLYGTQSVNLVVGFAISSLTQTLNQAVTINFIHPCKETSFTTSQTIANISYQFGDPSQIRTFQPFNDSVSTQYAITNLCVTQYKIDPPSQLALFGVTLTQSSLQIGVTATDITSIGQTVTLQLSACPTVQFACSGSSSASQSVNFTVEIVNPCPNTVISLPFTTLPNMNYVVTQTAISQNFAYGNDSKSILTQITNFCGSMVYSIEGYSFVTLTTGVDGGSIQIQTDSLQHVGVYTAILNAKLLNYPTVASANAPFQMTLVNPCLTTTLALPTEFVPVTIVAKIGQESSQVFAQATDSAGISANIPGLCGFRIYSIVEIAYRNFVKIGLSGSDPLADIQSLYFQSYSMADIGQWTVTLQASLELYPLVSSVTKTVSVTITDPCLTAQLQNQGQVLSSMTYYPLKSQAPSEQTFQPFSDNLATQFSDLQICGPKNYVIAESLSFIYITPPSTDPFENAWKISVSTQLLSDINSYTATIVAKLANYPSATPATLQFNVQISHPCVLTRLKEQQLTSMSFTIGFVQTQSQIFQQFRDIVGDETLNFQQCGERSYKLIDEYPFLNLITPTNPWNTNFIIELFTLDKNRIGQYIATLEVKLVGYDLPPPLRVSFSIDILPQPKNNLPYFNPKIPSQEIIQKTKNPTSWTFKLPAIADLDEDLITLTVDLGSAGNFLWLNGVKSIECQDISSQTTFKAGLYLVKIMLNDTKDTVTYNFFIFVVDLPPESIDLAKSEPLAQGKNDTVIEVQENSIEQLEQLSDGEQTLLEGQITEKMTEEKKEAVLTKATFDWKAAFAQQQALNKKLLNESSQQFSQVPPKPFFKDLKPDGQIILGFQSEVYVVPNLQMINNGTIYLDDVKINNRELAVDRMLGVKTTFNNKKKRIPVLSVEVVPGIESNAADLKFVWNVTTQETKSLNVQLYFENPYKVSANPIPDKVQITFNDPTLFVGMNGLTMDSQSQVIERLLPAQVPLTGAVVAVAAAIDSATNGAKAVVVGNFFLNILMSASLNQLWSLINTQQLIVLMPLFKVQMPANAQSFFNQILKIASFEIIDLTPTLQKMLHLNATEPLNPNFEALGFSSLYFLNNMNSMIIGFLVYLVMILLLILIDPFQYRCRKTKLSTVTERLRSLLFYNFIVSMMTESYSLMSVCTVIGLQKISFASFGEIIQTVSCFSALAVLIIYPLVTLILLNHNWKNKKEMKLLTVQFSPIFDDIRSDMSNISLLHPMYFLFRRFLMAIIVVILRNHLIFQVMLKAFSIIAAVIIDGSVFFHSVQKRKTEFLNESIIMLVLYNMICFSPLVPETKAKLIMGYFCCLVVSSHLFLNIYFMLSTQFFVIKMKAKFWFARRKLSKQRLIDQIKIKKRKHTLKHFLQSGNKSQDEEEVEIREQFKKPIVSKKHLLEPIEEEELNSEQESQMLNQNFNQEKRIIDHELALLEQLVNNHFDNARKEEAELVASLTKTKGSVNQLLKVQNNIPSRQKFQDQSQSKTYFPDKSANKQDIFYQLDSIIEEGEEERKITMTRSQIKEKQRLKHAQEQWNLGHGDQKKNSELQLRKRQEKSEIEKYLEQIIKETEEHLRKIQNDPDIEQLPSKLNSMQR